MNRWLLEQNKNATWFTRAGMRIPSVRADPVQRANVVPAASVGSAASLTHSMLDGRPEPLVPLIPKPNVLDAADQADDVVLIVGSVA